MAVTEATLKPVPDVFASIDDAIAAIARGEIVIVVDAPDRENEGDFVMAADKVTPDAVNFMVTHGRGLLCMPQFLLYERHLVPPGAEFRRGGSPSTDAPGGRISVFHHDGRLLARWGGGSNPCAPGDFFAPHDLCLDSRGDLYVGEVTWSAGGRSGMVPPDCHALQKFARRGQGGRT